MGTHGDVGKVVVREKLNVAFRATGRSSFLLLNLFRRFLLLLTPDPYVIQRVRLNGIGSCLEGLDRVVAKQIFREEAASVFSDVVLEKARLLHCFYLLLYVRFYFFFLLNLNVRRNSNSYVLSEAY